MRGQVLATAIVACLPLYFQRAAPYDYCDRDRARTLRDESIAQIARKIRALEHGEPIAGVVDRQRGY